ncbi:MAG: SRPBCC family protein [Acidimicrobiales bacterium]
MADLVREIVIDARPETVFGFLVDRDRHLAWMGTEAELDPRPGGAYRVLVQGRHPSVGEFVEVVPNERVIFTFGWDEPGHPIPAGSTTVECTLSPEGEKTRLRLAHRGLPEDAVGDHTQGWDHYLDRLQVVAVGGTVPPDAPPAGS